ncbi:MAG: hypothetical protein R2856_06730 [Caldilineaceae bacterium]
MEQLQAVQPPWNVNGLAQFAGEAALDELTWRDEIMAKMRRDLADFCEEIDSYGYAPCQPPSTTSLRRWATPNPCATACSSNT